MSLLPVIQVSSALWVLAAAPAHERMITAYEDRAYGQAVKLAREVLAGLDRVDGARTELVPGDDPVQIRIAAELVEAMGSLRLRRYVDAQQALDRLARAPVQLGHYLPYLQATVAAQLGQCEAAAGFAEAIPDGSIHRAPAWARVATCWLGGRQAEEADAAVEQLDGQLFSEQQRASAALLRARVLELQKEWTAAGDIYRQILVEYPTTSSARVARERLDALRARGVRAKPLGPDEMLAQADAERARQRVQPAKRLYSGLKQQVATLTRSSRAPEQKEALRSIYEKAELGLVELDIVNRSYKQALKRVGGLVRSSDPDVRARALYLKGDIQARRGNLSYSLKTFSNLIRGVPSHPFAMEAALSAANMAYSARYMTKARGFAQWLVESAADRESGFVVGDDGVHRSPEESGSARDHGYWIMAWNERRAGVVPEVVDSYLSQIDLRGPLGHAVLYWRMRLALETHDVEAALVFAEMLIHEAPTSYYGMLAFDQLRAAGIQPPFDLGIPRVTEPTLSVDERPARDGPDMLALVILMEHGLGEEARSILRTLPVGDLTGPDRLAAAWLYGTYGDIHRASLLARRSVMVGRDDIEDPVLFKLSFPRAFEDLVEHYAAEYGVPAELVFAIIREESSFNPKARSPRQARGLMQMIPTTARRMAKDAGVPNFSQRKLMEPEVSIWLGTHYVAWLLDRFDGNVVAAIASYHAGETKVEQWLETRSHLPPDDFIEDIPYASTRGYVKKVLGSMGVYRSAYRQGALDRHITLAVRRTGARPAVEVAEVAVSSEN